MSPRDTTTGSVLEQMVLPALQRGGPYEKAYLVLGGPGWSLREFYVGDGLRRYLANTEKVSIVNLEDFIATANRGRL